MDICTIQASYKSGKESPLSFFKALYPKLEKSEDSCAWIYLLKWEEIEVQINQLDQICQDPTNLPLYGIPFAVKDNIDVKDLPTTAGCPDYKYFAKESASVVSRLISAGAILVGKTNLDQFATGLVGTRSPFGTAKNALNANYIPGGSSSGSAVAVASNLVAFSLGTDTAGSGRVPAAMNGIIGLKPTRGSISCHGVVPACKTLDCVSIFANNIQDCATVFEACGLQKDPKDPYSRQWNPDGSALNLPHIRNAPAKLKIGIPYPEQLEFYGCKESQSAFDNLIKKIQGPEIDLIPVDFSVFEKAAKILYEGPWVTERFVTCEELLKKSPDSIHPVTREIVSAGDNFSAVDYFKSEYRLQEYRAQAMSVFESLDCILTPTIPRPYTLAEIEQEPIRFNSNLGTYTNFMNLLDLSAVAFPAGSLNDGLQFGATCFSLAFTDFQLMKISQRILDTFSESTDSTLSSNFCDPAMDMTDVAVCGAHLSGFPLNSQLTQRGAHLLKSTKTAPKYKLYDLMETHLPIKRPGIIQVDEGGHAIAVEVWRMPTTQFGSFVKNIPPPLGIGKCELESGEIVSSFICEEIAVKQGVEISSFGGWKTYIESLNH